DGKADAGIPREDYPQSKLANWLDFGKDKNEGSPWPYGHSAVAWDGKQFVAVWQRHHIAKSVSLTNCDLIASRVEGWKPLDGVSRLFDRQLGVGFLASVPTGPGVYRMLDAAGTVVYVGKAKNLRRRLSQYRNAKRRKKHLKMRAIVATAVRVDVVACASELDAELLEASLIRDLRPRWNVVGAFSFLYPSIGLGESASGDVTFAFSTQPEERPDLVWHGAYRSREITGEAFFALVRLLERVGHRTRGAARGAGARTYAFTIRRLPGDWRAQWSDFLDGDSRAGLNALVLALLERSSARRDAARVAKDLEAVERFRRHEVVPLRVARRVAGHVERFVPQAARDLLFIRARAQRVAIAPAGAISERPSP
ncbi:MAG: nucleotide excision repair endonuclease, partial [Deltaproteobacteria bacterium]